MLSIRLICLLLALGWFGFAATAVRLTPGLRQNNAQDPLMFSDPNAGGQPNNPGAKLRIGQRGVDFANTMTYPGMMAYLRANIQIDNITMVGDQGQLFVRNVRVADFALSPFSYSTRQQQSIDWRSVNGRFIGYGAWEFLPTNASLPKVTGGVTIVSYGIEMNISTWLSNKNGLAAVEARDCRLGIERMRVDLVGALVPRENQNLRKRGLIDVIRQHIEEEVCGKTDDFMKSNVNRALASFPIKTSLWDEQPSLTVDYSLISLEVKEKCVESSFKGMVINGAASTVPFYPVTIGLSNETADDKMAQFWLSDYTFNSLLHHLHWNGFLRRGLSADEWLPIGSPVRQRLSLSCAPKLNTRQNQPSCLGAVFQNVSRDLQADLVFRTTTKAPALIFREGYGVLDATGVIEAYVNASGKRILLAQADVKTLRAKLMPKLLDPTANISITVVVEVNEIQLGPYVPAVRALARNMDDDHMSEFASVSMPVVETMLTEMFAKIGRFPAPSLEVLEFYPTPQLVMVDRAIRFDADLRLKSVFRLGYV